MSTKPVLPQHCSYVTANNDVIYLWWSFPEKIDDCLGFTIHRIVDGVPTALPAAVGFDAQRDPRKAPQTTDVWPIQSFNWKDLYAPRNQKVSYKIIPMVGTWDDLRPLEGMAITTDEAKRTESFGNAKIIFNRGLLSTQALAKDNVKDLRTLIGTPGSHWRKRLGGQMLEQFEKFFLQAPQQGGKYYAALYELTDTELIQHLTNQAGNEIILSNANSSKSTVVDGKPKQITINDGTNAKVRTELHKKMKSGAIQVYDRMLGTHIGHNKFVIYEDENGNPQSILTGSTNWTSTGICGQTNNLVIIDSPEIASKYKEYWLALKDDKNQAKELRTWCRENGCEIDSGGIIYKLWYSPNTIQKNKPKPPAEVTTPIDMEEVFKIIENAKKSVLFLVFKPGSPSIINKIKEVSTKRPKNNPLFVRGAISDAALAKEVTTDIYSTNVSTKPDRYKVGSQKITGVAAIPGSFSYWEKELLKLGHSTIHDKLLVVDPFDEDCVVITGSHNLGYKASYANDENMLIIKNNQPIAQAYATHVLDVVNHFKWRYRLQSHMSPKMTEEEKRAVVKELWKDLDETPNWQNYYFGKNGFIDQYRLFLR